MRYTMKKLDRNLKKDILFDLEPKSNDMLSRSN